MFILLFVVVLSFFTSMSKMLVPGPIYSHLQTELLFSPAVIAAVCDGDRLLLTRYRSRPFKSYALVAGFNEIGESIEDTVRREVWEETGLRVKNLRFYRSQPWVFTDSLLMGFFADLEGPDTIAMQESELAEAGWFRRSDIPDDHSPISLTGEMIELFRTGGE